ncbi:putative Reverse transcriptase (fragment) [Nitrospira defluvii]|uniref:Putative Reverse transcriptase n=1 Tax=Nitrospira defluvii TaxID=330214 RepID=D8PH07_9BACT
MYFPVRYADDFIVLVSGAAEDAAAEREELATVLQQGMGLTLSPEKTRITPLTEGFEFLGHRVRMRWDTRYGWTPRIEVPKEKVADLRYTVKQLTGRATTPLPLIALLQKLNPILRGWAHFYRHCTGAKDILSNLDWYVGDRLWRWMRKKYPKAHARCYATAVQVVSAARVGYGKKMVASNFRCRCSRSSATSGGGCNILTSPRLLESRMHSERCMSGSARGRAKPLVARPEWRACPTQTPIFRWHGVSVIMPN